MGADRADTHLHLHGEGDDHHAPEVRLHWGALAIDETLQWERVLIGSRGGDHRFEDLHGSGSLAS